MNSNLITFTSVLALQNWSKAAHQFHGFSKGVEISHLKCHERFDLIIQKTFNLTCLTLTYPPPCLPTAARLCTLHGPRTLAVSELCIHKKRVMLLWANVHNNINERIKVPYSPVTLSTYKMHEILFIQTLHWHISGAIFFCFFFVIIQLMTNEN